MKSHPQTARSKLDDIVLFCGLCQIIELEDGITFCHCNDARNGSRAGTASKAGFGFHRIPSHDMS